MLDYVSWLSCHVSSSVFVLCFRLRNPRGRRRSAVEPQPCRSDDIAIWSCLLYLCYIITHGSADSLLIGYDEWLLWLFTLFMRRRKGIVSLELLFLELGSKGRVASRDTAGYRQYYPGNLALAHYDWIELSDADIL